MRRTLLLAPLLIGLLAPALAAAGGPFGIDHRVAYDNSGIWKRSTQKDVEYATALTVLGGALLLGDRSDTGDTFWRAVDATAFSAATAQVMKWTFGRERPSETDDPNRWFKGSGHQSFPSGEVTLVASAVTPFVARYGAEHPAVYALEMLPLYDSIARVKVRGHWQSDVLAGWALGTGFGIWAARTDHPLILSWLPGGFAVGIVHRF